LQDKQDNITSSACEEEVFYYQLMEVTDFRNDVILAEACRTDVDKYCKDVEPGGCMAAAVLVPGMSNVVCAGCMVTGGGWLHYRRTPCSRAHVHACVAC
jgi:hypothetical protein